MRKNIRVHLLGLIMQLSGMGLVLWGMTTASGRGMVEALLLAILVTGLFIVGGVLNR